MADGGHGTEVDEAAASDDGPLPAGYGPLQGGEADAGHHTALPSEHERFPGDEPEPTGHGPLPSEYGRLQGADPAARRPGGPADPAGGADAAPEAGHAARRAARSYDDEAGRASSPWGSPPAPEEVRPTATVAPPAAERPVGARPTALRRPRDPRAPRTVRSRRLVRRLDVLSVFKVSIAFYAVAFLVLLVAGIVVWNVADAFGLLTSIQKSVRTLFSLKTFTIHAGSTLLWSLLIGAVLCVFGALLNALLATIYNLLSDVVGGVEVVVVSEVVDGP